MRRTRSSHADGSVVSGATTPNRSGLVMSGLLVVGAARAAASSLQRVRFSDPDPDVLRRDLANPAVQPGDYPPAVRNRARWSDGATPTIRWNVRRNVSADAEPAPARAAVHPIVTFGGRGLGPPGPHPFQEGRT